jgi:hypothetical protein
MVLKQVFWFFGGVGLASFPIYGNMHLSLKNEQRDIHEEFKRQRELVYFLKMRQLEAE